MNTLRIDDCQSFLDRFWSGSDGVIRSFSISFQYRSQEATRGTVTLSVRDSQSQQNEGWVNLVVEMGDVIEFAFREGSTSYQVISSEIHIAQFSSVFFIDFGGCIEQPKDVHGFRASDFYCASRTIYWKVEPYQD
jgi:hypothetical protein